MNKIIILLLFFSCIITGCSGARIKFYIDEEGVTKDTLPIAVLESNKADLEAKMSINNMEFEASTKKPSNLDEILSNTIPLVAMKQA